jgi:O-antigen ligase
LQAGSLVPGAIGKGAVLLVAVVGATASVVLLPTIGMQLALTAAVFVTIASLLMARAGRLLNAAVVLVVAIYLVDPLDSVLPLIGSPVPMFVVVAVAPIPFVLTALWLRPESREHLVLFAPLAFLLSLAVLSLIWSPDTEYGVRKLTLWVLTGLLPCVFMLVLSSPTRLVSWRLIAAAAFVYAVVLLLIGSYAAGYPGRLVFFDSNPIGIARAVYIGALVAIFGPFPTSVKVILVVPMVVAGHLTDSLGPTLGLVIGGAAGVLLWSRLSDATDSRARRIGPLAGVVVAIGMTVAVAALVSGGSSSLTPVLNDPDVTSRAQYLQVAAQTFAQNPVFGAGLGAFASNGFADQYPHNMYIEVASELGVIGLIPLLGWLVLALRGAARSPVLLSLVVATSIYALFSGSLASNAEFWICTGIAVAAMPIRRWATRASPAFAT